MPKSMTGYGSSLIQTDHWSINWEIKSVNSKFLDLKWKIPQTMYRSVAGWEKTIRAKAARGRVELFLKVQINDPDLLGLELDTTMMEAMLSQLEKVAAHRGHTITPDYNTFLSMPSLWKDTGSQPHPQFTADIQQGLATALDDWNRCRTREGRVLLEDLTSRLEVLKAIVLEIRAVAKDIVKERFALVQERVNHMLEQMEIQIDDSRMLQELAILADKLDVSEELTRLDAHLTAMEKVLTAGGEMGRKLDFLLQECFREITTCGNKVQKHTIGARTVAFKTELEKCREQVQNLE
ncbi:MAG: YicC family protein [Deltaproteobacteria bacterium]|nr:MAG: YicC family protein [Deltaproteobacteria bacterium]